MWRHSSAVLQRSSKAWETTSSLDEIRQLRVPKLLPKPSTDEWQRR
jgi:hypothetical protein